MKCIFTIIFILWTSQSFSQKVLIIRKPVKGLRDGEIYFDRDTLDTKANANRTVTFKAQNTDSAYIITAFEDSVNIAAYNERMEWFSDNKYPRTRPSGFFFKHIQEFPGDTIVISGLSFTEYPYIRTVSVIYTWKPEGDSCYLEKPLKVKKSSKKEFIKSIPYPKIQLMGDNVIKHLTLTRRTGLSVSYYCNPGKDSYHDTYEWLYLTFELDLADRK